MAEINKIVNILKPSLAESALKIIFQNYIEASPRNVYIEVRGNRLGDKDITFRRFYSSIAQLMGDMEKWEVDLNYWFGVSLRKSDKRGKKQDCATLTCLYSDVDYGQDGHRKKNKWQTREEAELAIKNFKYPPSILIHTGGGFQCYWLLYEPIDLQNGDYSHVETIMKGIGQAIGGDAGTQDISRVFRIPGTFNVKIPDNPRHVELIQSDPEKIYKIDDFAEFETVNVTKETQKQPQTEQQNPSDVDSLTVPVWVKNLINTGDITGYGDRSGRDHAVIGALYRAGYTLDSIETIFRKNPVGDKYREKKEHGRQYLEYSLNKDNEKKAAPPKEPFQITGITGLDLSVKDFPTPRWAVKKLLPEGYGILAGKPKTGKSWLGLGIALATACGGYVLGSDLFPAEIGKALYISLEDTERRLKDRQDSLMYGEAGPKNLFISTQLPRLNEGGFEALENWLRANPECRLVVIDTLQRVLPRAVRGQDQYEAAVEVGARLSQLAADFRICLLVVHHTRKSKSESGDFLEEIMGSIGISGSADFVMVLSRGRRESTGLLQITGRDLEEQELGIKFDGKGQWTYVGEGKECNLSDQKTKILDLLKETSDSLTPKDIADITGIPHGSVKHMLLQLKDDGLVKKQKRGEYSY